MPSGFSIAAEFRASRSTDRGARLRLRLRRALAAVQGQWQGGDAPTWADWRARHVALDAAVPPSFVAAMSLAHGGVGSPPVPNVVLESIEAQRALWLAPRLPMTRINVATVWRGLAERYGIAEGLANAVTFSLDASHGQCHVLVPGRAVAVWLRGGASAAAWHDCLHELGHAVVALCTVHDVPRTVDEAAADLIAAQLVDPARAPGGGLLDDFADLVHVAAQMRQHRTAVAQRLAVAEATGQSTAAAGPPWALWHDPGAQAAYVAAAQLVMSSLPNGCADRGALREFIEQGTRAVDACIAGLPGDAW
ncbi:MAG: hypothetical protein KBG15_20920 [Kofleriaceae bacterium]|nr:hypothetical protein [Kofleriaceae bacterium]